MIFMINVLQCSLPQALRRFCRVVYTVRSIKMSLPIGHQVLFLGLCMLLGMVSLPSLAQVKAKKSSPIVKKAVPVASAQKAKEEEIVPISGDPTKDNVAIYPFTSATGYDYDYAQSVGNAVESGFVRSTRFNVVERNRFGSISKEEQFKEVNTSSIVKIAAKFGAKYIITGHVTGANTGETYDSQNKFSGYQTTISVAFKIIEVETGLIKVAESIIISGSGGSTASAKGAAYQSIDGITRRIIAANFPLRFKFMAVGLTDVKKKQEVLRTFKFWGGSENGIKVGDVVEVFYLTYAVNPANNKKVEEKNNIGIATITAVNSSSTSTCEVYKPGKYGLQLLEAVTKTPELVVIEYTGGAKPRGFFDF